MSLDSTYELAASGRLYPAVIVHGGDPEARQAAALELARTLLCAAAPPERPCGDCRHCRRIVWPGPDAPFHPDFAVLEQDRKTVTSVDATKELLRAAQVTPFEARGQVFVVARAETLSGEAANALLKSLEEPHETAPRHFLLLAPSELDLLPTLRSRSLAVFLGGATRPEAAELAPAAGAFRRAVAAWAADGNTADLGVAGAVLEGLGGWEDARARGPWERAAAVVLAALAEPGLDAPLRRRLTAFAQDLLDAPRLRLRGVPARRLIEGMLDRRLASRR